MESSRYPSDGDQNVVRPEPPADEDAAVQPRPDAYGGDCQKQRTQDVEADIVAGGIGVVGSRPTRHHVEGDDAHVGIGSRGIAGREDAESTGSGAAKQDRYNFSSSMLTLGVVSH